MARLGQFRRDTYENWMAENPILADGEFFLVAMDSSKPKEYNKYGCGDGTSTFSELKTYLFQEGGSGGTTNYNDLDNKPSINGVSLSGNKTSEDLKLSASVSQATETVLGGIKAAPKTANETVEAKIDPNTGKMFVPAGGMTAEQQNKLNSIEQGANKTVVEQSLTTSTTKVPSSNAVKNEIDTVKSELNVDIENNTSNISALQTKVNALSGIDSPFVGYFDSSSKLPTQTTPAWALVGDLATAKPYAYYVTGNVPSGYSAGWNDLSGAIGTYDFTDLSKYSSTKNIFDNILNKSQELINTENNSVFGGLVEIKEDITDDYTIEENQKYGTVGEVIKIYDVNTEGFYTSTRITNTGSGKILAVDIKTDGTNQSSAIQYVDENNIVLRLDIISTTFAGLYTIGFQQGEAAVYVSSFKYPLKVYSINLEPNNLVTNKEFSAYRPISFLDITEAYSISEDQKYGNVGESIQTFVSDNHNSICIGRFTDEISIYVYLRSNIAMSSAIQYVDADNIITRKAIIAEDFRGWYPVHFEGNEKFVYVSTFTINSDKIKVLAYSNGNYLKNKYSGLFDYVLYKLNAINNVLGNPNSVYHLIPDYPTFANQAYGNIGETIQYYEDDNIQHAIIYNDGNPYSVEYNSTGFSSAVQYVDNSGIITRLDILNSNAYGTYHVSFKNDETHAYVSSNKYKGHNFLKVYVGTKEPIIARLEYIEKNVGNMGYNISNNVLNSMNSGYEFTDKITNIINNKLKVIKDYEYETFGTLKGQGGTDVPAGTKRGIIYSDCYEVDKYVFFDVSLYTYLTAINNPYSLMYTEDIQHNKSGYGFVYKSAGTDNNIGGYMGTVCNNYVDAMLGFNIGWGLGAYKALVKDGVLSKLPVQSAQFAFPGCIIANDNHARFIYKVDRDMHGMVYNVYTTDSVGNFPVSREETVDEFNNTLKSYTLYKYNKPNENVFFPESECYDSLGNKVDLTYNDNICTFAGDKAVFRKGQKIFINYNLKGSSSFDNLEIYKGNNLVDTLPLTVDEHSKDITHLNLEEGFYKARLKDGTHFSDYTYFHIIDTVVSVDIVDADNIVINFSSKEGIPVQFNACKISGAPKAYYKISDEEAANGSITINISELIKSQYDNRNVGDTYIKVFFEGIYGRVTSEYIKI